MSLSVRFIFSVLCVSFASAAISTTSNAGFEDFEIEKYIPARIKPTCTAVILSPSVQDFRPMPNRPMMLLTGNQKHLVLRDYCNVLVIPNLASVQGILKIFNLENRVNIEATLVYSFPGNPITIKQVRRFFRDLDVVLIDVAQNTSKLYQYPIRCGHSLTCKTRNRLLRVGFTSTPPSFGMAAWSKREASGIPFEPFMVNQTNPVQNYFTGYEAELLALLVDFYQMRFLMKAPADFEYGTYPFPNGSYPGKFGLLQRGEVDLVIGSLATSSERSKLGSYSPPISVAKFSLISLKDETVQNWDAAIRPFPQLAWGILGLSILFVAPVTWFITKKHRQLMNIENIKNDSIGMYFAHATATLLVEPWPRPPGGPAAIILSAWFIACLVLQSIYASNFAVSLSFPDTEGPIASLQDVYNRKRQIMVTPGTSVDWYFRQSKDPIAQAVYKNRASVKKQSDENLFVHLDEGLVGTFPALNFFGRMAAEGIDSDKYYVAQNPPLLTSFRTWLFEEDDVQMAREIAMVILRASAAGLFNKWENDLQQKLKSKFEYISAHAQSIHLALSQKNMALAMGHLEGVFKFWVIGMVLGFLTFTYEVTFKPSHNACTGAVQKAKIRKQLKNYTFLN